MTNEPPRSGEASPNAPRGGRSCAATVLLLLVASGAGVLFGRSCMGPAEEPPKDEVVLAPSPSVVVGLRELARLEGMVVYVERVIDLRERQSVFGLVGAEDAILLVAGGEVTAGVDLRALSERAVEADFEAKRARIVLPHATIFSRSLASDRTYVHTRSTDLLARRKEDLETRARKEAEGMLEAAALEAGILEKAEASVERTVEGLLRSLGFEDVEIGFGDAPSAEATVLDGPR